MAACAVLAVAVRLGVSSQLPRDAALAHAPFSAPRVRPPLWDLLGTLSPGLRPWLPMVAGGLAVLSMLWLLRSERPRLQLAAALMLALWPAAVLLGSRHVALSLSVAVLPALAAGLRDTLEGRRNRGLTALLTGVVLLTDWAHWPVVAAWLLWVAAFVPDSRARNGAIQALGIGVACAAAITYGWLRDASPLFAASRLDQFPRGPASGLAILDSWGGLLLGRLGSFPVAVRLVLDGLVVAAVGPILARPGLLPSILGVGLFGGFVAAIAFHQWVPSLGDKHAAASAALAVAAVVIVRGTRAAGHSPPRPA